MLSPPSDNDAPLFSSHSPLGCCGPMVIQRSTECSESFDWSDFPVIVDASLMMQEFPLRNHDDFPPSMTELSTCSSTDSSVSAETSSSDGNKKRVSFAAHLEVRTHSVVLGDHPCCPQLALELGWEHDGGRAMPMAPPQDIYAFRFPRKRSYFERKQMLKEVGGMTDSDIRNTTLRHAKASTRALSELGSL